MNNELHSKYRSPEDLKALPQWDEKEVALLWRIDWFDGPLNGMMAYRGGHYWFDICCDADEGPCSYYLVFETSGDEFDSAKARHKAWIEQNVEWEKAGRPDPREFFNDVGKEPSLAHREPVAWFSSGSNRAFYGGPQVVPRPVSGSGN